MTFKDRYNFDQLENEAKNLVIDELEQQLGEYPEPICTCEDCVLDMATLSLNAIRPLYRVSLLGSLYTAHAMENPLYADAVKTAVKDAIDKVHAHPSHD